MNKATAMKRLEESENNEVYNNDDDICGKGKRMVAQNKQLKEKYRTYLLLILLGVVYNGCSCPKYLTG